MLTQGEEGAYKESNRHNRTAEKYVCKVELLFLFVRGKNLLCAICASKMLKGTAIEFCVVLLLGYAEVDCLCVSGVVCVKCQPTYREFLSWSLEEDKMLSKCANLFWGYGPSVALSILRQANLYFHWKIRSYLACLKYFS